MMSHTGQFHFVTACCVGSCVWIIVTTFSRVPVGLITENGTLCPRVTVCAETWYALVLLFFSRSSAYFCYPLMMLLFLSKANNLRTALERSFLSVWIPFHDLHHLHVVAGSIVAFDVWVHGVAHIVRWATQARARSATSTSSGGARRG
jgi:hypothetical protein